MVWGYDVIGRVNRYSSYVGNEKDDLPKTPSPGPFTKVLMVSPQTPGKPEDPKSCGKRLGFLGRGGKVE